MFEKSMLLLSSGQLMFSFTWNAKPRLRFGQAFFTDVLGNVLGNNAGSGDGNGDGNGNGDGIKIEPEYMETDAAAAAVVERAGVNDDNSLSALLCGNDDDDDLDGGVGGGVGGGEYGNTGWGAQQEQLGARSQEPLQERSVLVLDGDRALTPPAHGSTNMQRAMQDAMPEYERLQRAVDG